MDFKFQRVTNTDNSLFHSLWNLYEDAFPIMERRELFLQKIVLNQSSYHCDAILYKDELAGFILWWQFIDAIYIEHLAINNTLRGQGLGATMLGEFITNHQKTIILEVELPHSTINKRRIAFYERLGFKLNNHAHKQWPLRKAGDEVDLLVMSHPNQLTNIDFLNFKKELEALCFEPYSKYISV
jgi:ribosomal protein S18 acetylase RimI-like enzyme